MPKQFDLSIGDLSITITGPSAHFFGGDLYTQAVVALIQEADTNGWDKEQRDHGESFDDAGNQFYAAIFIAVVRHAAMSGVPIPEGITVAEWLRVMIDYLAESGRLTATIIDDDEGDPEFISSLVLLQGGDNEIAPKDEAPT